MCYLHSCVLGHDSQGDHSFCEYADRISNDSNTDYYFYVCLFYIDVNSIFDNCHLFYPNDDQHDIVSCSYSK